MLSSTVLLRATASATTTAAARRRAPLTLRLRAPPPSARQSYPRRLLSSEGEAAAAKAAAKDTVSKEAGAAASTQAEKEAVKTAAKEDKGWWHSAEFWGRCGAIAGWGMSGAAIYDAAVQGPEIISLNMTGVLIVYSSLFARWAYVVKPQNLLLASCHVTNIAAQLNQMRRGLDYKTSQGEHEEVKDMTMKAGATAALGAGCVALGPMIQSALVGANLGIVSAVAAADAGPFTVHFWAPMSKWLISGASFMDLHRPTEQISVAQYTALTFTGLFFSRYALLVAPINYTLCSVNIALFGSSAWHLGRKINADYIEDGPTVDTPAEEEKGESKGE